MPTAKHSLIQILEILQQAENGVSIAILCRKYRISSVTFYTWKSIYTKKHMAFLSTLKELQRQNQRLKDTYAEVQQQQQLIQDILYRQHAPGQSKGDGQDCQKTLNVITIHHSQPGGETGHRQEL